MPLFETISHLFSTSAVKEFSLTIHGDSAASGDIRINHDLAQQQHHYRSRRRRVSATGGARAPASTSPTSRHRSSNTDDTGGVQAPLGPFNSNCTCKCVSTGTSPSNKRRNKSKSKRKSNSKGPGKHTGGAPVGGNSTGRRATRNSKSKSRSSGSISKRVDAAVNFANKNYLCGDPSCSWKVAPGDFQDDYECAEFVSRSLAAGGFIPGLKPKATPQSDYATYDHNGQDYHLWNTYGLDSFLRDAGWRQKPNDYSSVGKGCVVIGDPGDGYFAHTCLGVGGGLVTCHNAARKQVPVSDEMVDGVNAVWCPPKK